MNAAIYKMPGLKIKELHTGLFVNGKTYFEKGSQYFANRKLKTENILVIHNNWILTKSAKIYRFKESLMWMNDGTGYYSDAQHKYLKYENPIMSPASKKQGQLEIRALVNAFAIGEILNRTVILPTFTCGKNTSLGCPLNSLFSVQDFDRAVGDGYREHVFLKHPKVPQTVKSSVSPMYYINYNLKNQKHIDSSNTIFLCKKESITDRDIMTWFEAENDYSVLRFHALYFSFSHFWNDTRHTKFQRKMSCALQKDNYMQMKYYNTSS